MTAHKGDRRRITLRFPSSLANRIKADAEAESMPLNDWIVRTIERHVVAETKADMVRKLTDRAKAS